MGIIKVNKSDTFESWRQYTNRLGAAAGIYQDLYKHGTATFTGVSPSTTPGVSYSGSLPEFTISTNNGAYTLDSIDVAGTGFAINDEVTVSGSDIGGADGTNDATVTITSVGLGTGEVLTATIAGTSVSSLTAESNKMRDELGTEILTTTDQTLSEAINELHGEIGDSSFTAAGTGVDLGSDLTDAVNALKTQVDSNKTSIGTTDITAIDGDTDTITGALVQLHDELGDAAMGTTATTVTGAIKEHEDLLGNVTMGTTATTVTGAIKEHEDLLGDTSITDIDGDTDTITGALVQLHDELGDAAMGTTATTVTGAINELHGEIGNSSFTAAGTGVNLGSDLTGAVNALKTQVDSNKTSIGTGTLNAQGASENTNVTYVNIADDLTDAANALKTGVDGLRDEVGGAMSTNYTGAETNIISALNSLYTASGTDTLDGLYLKRNGGWMNDGATLHVSNNGIGGGKSRVWNEITEVWDYTYSDFKIKGYGNAANNYAERTDIKINDTGKIGLGGDPGTTKVKVTGTVNATTGFQYNGTSIDNRYLMLNSSTGRTIATDITTTGSTTLNPDSTKSLVIGTETVFTGGSLTFSEYIADLIGGMVSNNDENDITVTYQDEDNTLDFSISDSFVKNTSDTMSGNLTVEGTITVGKDGGGDSSIHFYDDNSDSNRTLRWDDSGNKWEVEDNVGTFRTLIHSGNFNSFDTTSFVVEDGDGDEVTISMDEEWKFVEGTGSGATIDIDWTDTSTQDGSDANPYNLTFAVTNTDKGSSQYIFKNFQVADSFVGNWAQTGTISADTNDDTVKFVSGNDLDLDVDTASDAILVQHKDITRTDATSSASPASGGTFTVIDSITSNNRGHITAANLKTITLPVDTNTNTTYDLTVPESTTKIRLAGSDTTNDDIEIEGGSNVTVTRESATKLKISSSYTDTTYLAATTSTLGLIELFSDTDQSEAANTVSTTAGRTYGIQLNSDDQAVVNVPWANTNTTYSAGDGISMDGTEFSVTGGTALTQDTNGLSVTTNGIGATQLNVTGNGTTTQYLRSDGDGSFSWATPTNTTYTTATSSTLGLVKIGYSENGKKYPVELSSSKMFVNVPWTDTTLNSAQDSSSALSVGKDAGATLEAAASTGTYNVYLGPKAGFAQTDGDDNVMVGRHAGFWTDLGDKNVGVGNYALYSDVGSSVAGTADGENNTAIGYMAGFGIAAGSDNIFVGYQAGKSVKTGDDNTIIGSLNGSSALSATVLIGAGSTERLKVDSTGLYVNGSTTAVGGYNMQVFTSSGTYTKSSGVKSIKVTVVGGGGGGGATYGGNYGTAGGGGGMAIDEIPAASLSATTTVTIGGGGARGVSPGWVPNNGGTSSFGSFCSATGGECGSTYVWGGSNGDGGTGSGGLINAPGSGNTMTFYSNGGWHSRTGGNSPLTGRKTHDGSLSGYYGHGGFGSSSSAQAGNGVSGIVIVEEFF